MTSTNRTDLTDDVRGRDVYGADGQKIGTVGQLYSSEPGGAPTWASVNTGLFGLKESMVPLGGASLRGDQLHVAFDKATVKDAPNVDTDHDEPLGEDQVRDLYQYYNVGGGEQRQGQYQEGYQTGNYQAEGYQTEGYQAEGYQAEGSQAEGYQSGDYQTGGRDDGAMTRSEERLNVDTRTERTGTARLRKYIVTENVQTTVPVQREEVRLEREPISEANRDSALAGPDLTESEHEVTLHAERPVVEKETVPVERVRLGKQAVTEEETVGGDIRKEQIEADLPDEQRRRLD